MRALLATIIALAASGVAAAPAGAAVSAGPVVIQALPAITSVSPAHASVGQTVTLTGANFTGASAVTLSGFNATFNVVSATQITATVPDTGFTQGRWRVTTSSGTGLYDPLFTTDPPLVSALSATHALIGQQVTLNGFGFSGATSVTLGGVNATFTVDSPTQITATVPDPKTTAARWRVTSFYGTGLYDPVFTIDTGPMATITSLSVSHAGIGQQVILTGTSFTGATAVTLGGVAASFTVDSPTQITATVPDPKTTAARWRVTNLYGTATYDPIFTIDPPPLPTIMSLSASHASVGKQVILTGTAFSGATAVTLGGVAASFTVDSPTQITATVPDPKTTAARWRVTNLYGTATYDPIFTIDPPPVPAIASQSTSHAPLGQQVTLTGTGFDTATVVTLGGVGATFTIDSPTQITARVPDAGASQARWRVTNLVGTGLLDPVFTIDPPLVSTLSAGHALIGQQLTLNGAGFVHVTAVTLGGVNAPFTVDSATQITVTVPDPKTTAARWRVVNPYGTGLYDPVFTIDVDTTAPTVTIVSRPRDPSNDTAPVFSFTADEAEASFECSLDGAPFASCSSPKSYAALSGGNHEFRARATDRAGNVGAPATAAWTIDTAAPPVAITSQPANPTNDTAPTFAFSSGETGASFQCALDGGAFAGCASPATFGIQSTYQSVAAQFPAWTSGSITTFATLAVSRDTSRPSGAQTVAALELNRFDTNDPQQKPLTPFYREDALAIPDSAFRFDNALGQATLDLTVNLVEQTTGAMRPVTFHVVWSGAGAVQRSASSDLVTSSRDAVASGSISDPTTSYVGGPDSATSLFLGLTKTVNPGAHPGLADGAHTFAVRATDAAGNVGPATSYGWSIDATGPPVTIDSKPGDPSGNSSPSIAFSSPEAGATLECALDGAGFAPCTSPAALSGLADGAHTFAVRAADSLGNRGAAADYGWTVDTVGPAVTIDSDPADPSASRSASFAFSSESGATFRCAMDSGAFAACSSPQSYSALTDGAHTFRVEGADAAGNTGPATSYDWTIDTKAPTVTITAKPVDPTNTAAPSFSFTAEVGARYECALDGAAMAACSSPQTYPALSDGSHTFGVRAIDAAGNVGATVSSTWTVDTGAPSGAFTTPGGGTTVSGTVLVGASAADTGTGVAGVQFTLDGTNLGAEDTTAPYSAIWDTTTAVDGAHTLGAVVRDAAGNRAAVTVIGVTVKNAPDTGTAGTQVDVGPGFVDATTRQVVRTASDRVYIFAADDTASIQKAGPGVIRAYRAGETGIPRTFSEADAANRPRSGASTNQILAGVDARLDANGTVHLVYVDDGDFTLVYKTFDTRTDRWGASQVLATGVGEQKRGRISYGLALDNNENPHVVYGKGTTGLFYVNKVSGSWSAPTQLSADPAALHPSLAFDGAGNLHVAWLEGGTTPRIVYNKRLATGTWQGNETVANTGVLTNSNADQGPSIVVTRSGVPYVLYVGAPVTTSAVRVKFRSGNSWVLDATPTDLYTHTPQIYATGDDIYVFLGHDIDINYGYEVHLAGRPWSPYQKLNAEQHDGSANVRWDPRRDNNPGVIDTSYFDEDRLHDRSFLPELYYMAVLPTPNTAQADTAAPTVSMTAPADGATVSGPVNVNATAADDVGVAGVQFMLDGSPLGAEDTTVPYGVNWDTTTASRGSHTLTAIARDNAGHATTSTLVTVSVQNVAPSGLVGAWGFETACVVGQSGGGGYCDASGNNNTAFTTATGPTRVAGGKSGSALSFDGIDDMAEVLDANTLDLTNGMTLEAWVQPTAQLNWSAVLFKERPATAPGLVYALYANSDTANANRPSAHVFIGTTDQNFRAGSTLLNGTWMHLALTYDGATMKLYENGTLVGSKAVTGAMTPTTGALHIGGDQAFGNEWFKGLIDEVRVYNRALSAAEITTDMGTPIGG